MPNTNLTLNYNVPISEFNTIEQDFIIQGIAINATVTANNHKFLPEELKSSAASLTGVPLLVDHDNRVESIKGKVIIGGYDEVNPRVTFKAKVFDENIKSLIKNGMLNTVSIGAAVSHMDESDDGIVTPRGIVFKELSLVAVPADAGATFTKAMFEAYNLNKTSKTKEIISQELNSIDIELAKLGKTLESSLSIDNENLKGGLNKMSENKVSQELKVEAVAEKVDTNLALMEAIKALTAKVESMEKAKVVESEVEEKAELPSNSKYTIEQGYGSLRGASFTIKRK